MLNRAIRLALRAAYRLARLWWYVSRPTHTGAAVAVWYDGKLLLVRHSYRDGYGLPGGGIGRGETPAMAASRELKEEVGIDVLPERLVPRGAVPHSQDFRRNVTHLLEYRPEREPLIRIDNREIVEAAFIAPDEALGLLPHGEIRRYLRGILEAGRGKRPRPPPAWRATHK